MTDLHKDGAPEIDADDADRFVEAYHKAFDSGDTGPWQALVKRYPNLKVSLLLLDVLVTRLFCEMNGKTNSGTNASRRSSTTLRNFGRLSLS